MLKRVFLKHSQAYVVLNFTTIRKNWWNSTLLPTPGNQAAVTFLIQSYFYGFLNLRSEQVAGIYSVADRRRAYGCAYYMCMHLYRLAENNQ